MKFLKFFLILQIIFITQNFPVNAFQEEEESNEHLLGRIIINIIEIYDSCRFKTPELEQDFHRVYQPITSLYECSSDQETQIGQYYLSKRRSFKVMPLIERIIRNFQENYQIRDLDQDYAKILLRGIGIPNKKRERAKAIASTILGQDN